MQRGRDKSIAKMSVPELRREGSRMWDHQLQQAQHAEVKQTKRIRRIKKSRSKLDQMDRKKLTDLLFDFDPKRLISNTAVRVPDPQKAKEKQRLDASQAVAAAVSAASRTTSAVAEAAGTAANAAASVPRPSEACCVELVRCRCGLCRCCLRSFGTCWRKLCSCRSRVSEALVEAIRRKPHRGSLKVDLKGPNEVSDSEDEQDEEGGRGYARWGTVGQLQMQFELLPKALAEERPVGKGRDEPNQFPALEEPEREKFSLNPFTTLATLVGPAFAAKLWAAVLAVVCCFLVVLMFPLILSNIIAHASEKAMGLD